MQRKEIIPDSAVFRESVLPFHKSGLSGVDKSVGKSIEKSIDHLPPDDSVLEPATFHSRLHQILPLSHWAHVEVSSTPKNRDSYSGEYYMKVISSCNPDTTQGRPNTRLRFAATE
jgi:hypothetical protein